MSNQESLLLLSKTTSNSPRVKKNKSTTNTSSTITIPNEEKMAKETIFPLSKLKGMSWSAFAPHTRGLGLSNSSDDEDIPISELSEKVHKSSGKASKHHKHHNSKNLSSHKAGVVRLDRSDMGLFGLCPETDPFYVVVCDHCDAVVKPQGLQQHMTIKHGLQYSPSGGGEFKTDESSYISRSSSSSNNKTSSSKGKSKNGSKSSAAAATVYTSKPSSSSSKTYSSSALIDTSPQPNESSPLIPTIVPSTTSSSGVSSDCPSPGSSSTSSAPALGKGGKKIKKVLPLKEREYDPDKHCGVYTNEKKNCMRSLTCKSHTLSSRRAVPGRSKTFDKLLLEHRQVKDGGTKAQDNTAVIELESSSNSCSSFASALIGDSQDPPTRPGSQMAMDPNLSPITVVESPFKNSSNSSSPSSNRSKQQGKRSYRQHQQQTEVVDATDASVGVTDDVEAGDKSFKSKKFKSSNVSNSSNNNISSNEVLDKSLQKLVQQKVHAKYQMEQQERENQTNRAADLFAQRFTQEIPNTILTDATVVMDPNTNTVKLSVSGTLKPTNEAEAPEEQIQHFASTLMQEPITVTVPLSVISTMNLNDPNVAGNSEMMMIEQIATGQTHQELQIPTYEEYVSLAQNLPPDQTMQTELSENIDDIVPTINLLQSAVAGEFSESIILANNTFIEDDSMQKDALSVNMNSTDFSKLLLLKNVDEEYIRQSQEQKIARNAQFDEMRGVKVWYNQLPKPLHINNFQMRKIGGSLVMKKKLLAIRKAMVNEAQNLNTKTLSAQISPLPRTPNLQVGNKTVKDLNGSVLLQNSGNNSAVGGVVNRLNNNRGQRRLIVVTKRTGLGTAVLNNQYFKNLLGAQSGN